MGLACSQVTLLTLTRRKADVELDIALNARRKMALTSEMSELTREYNSKLQAKNISYYYNNEYQKVSYGYLMGYGANHSAITNGDKPLKEDNNMILTDHNGMVVFGFYMVLNLHRGTVEMGGPHQALHLAGIDTGYLNTHILLAVRDGSTGIVAGANLVDMLRKSSLCIGKVTPVQAYIAAFVQSVIGLRGLTSIDLY